MSHFLGKQMLILVCHVCLKFKRNSQFKTRLSKTADSRLNINASWVLPLILLVLCLTLSIFHQALHCFRRSHNCKTGQNQFIQGYTSNDSEQLFDDQLIENNGFTLKALNPGLYLWFSWFHFSLSTFRLGSVFRPLFGALLSILVWSNCDFVGASQGDQISASLPIISPATVTVSLTAPLASY